MTLSVQESYDKIAKYFSNTRVFTWKWTDNFIKTLEYENINININEKENNNTNNNNNTKLILDIGSGNGRNSNYKNHIIFGIDISLQQLKNKQKNSIILDCQANMIKIPFKDNTFDAILSIASFHHLSTENEREECLKEIKRVLIPCGKVLLSVWSINQPKKTRRTFDKYGDTIVYWNTNEKQSKSNEKQVSEIVPRYYYIFELNELKTLLQKYFSIDKYYWDCGNEIFELCNE